jgi:hypothetical protein
MKEVKKSPAKKVAPKAAAKKPSAPKAPAKKAAPKAAPKKAGMTLPGAALPMIQDAAYFIAERHGFNGDSAYFWSLAEAEISSTLS